MNILTTLYGLIGTVCLLCSARQRDSRATWLGMVMMVSWLVQLVSVEAEVLGRFWSFSVVIPVDGAIALLIAHDLTRHKSLWGAWIFALFGAEMLIDVMNGLLGTFGSDVHFAETNVVWLIQVLIGGGFNVARTIDRWNDRRFVRARTHHLGR